jgi:hypothetical protein
MAVSNDCHVLVEQTVDTRHGADPKGIRAFSKCRDERLRLPAFLRHYRDLGVDRFFIVDNDSSDGTTEYLAGQPDVQLFRTAGRFSESRGGTDWLNALLREFGVGAWCVTVDIDELLVYPGSERTPLRTLTEYLDRNGYQALSCLLLDLYPAGPLCECSYKTGDDLLAAAPYFDAGPYEKLPVDVCPGVLIRGGIRERVFYPEFRKRGLGVRIWDAVRRRAARRAPFLHELPWLRERLRCTPPVLTKVPLVRWDAESKYLNSLHWISRRIVAPDTGALLHFKFLADFHGRALQETARGEYYNLASEYRRYAQKLNANTGIVLVDEGSTRFEGTAQLVRLGLMHDTQAWADTRDCRIE